MHGAFTIPFATLGLKEKEQSCHHEVWMHLSHAYTRAERAPRYKQAWRLHLREKIRHMTQQRKNQGPPVRKRPFARVKGHPCDPCFHEHRVERFQHQHVCQALRSVTGRNKRPLPLVSLLFPLVHVARCIHVTLHVALHQLKRLKRYFQIGNAHS